MIPRTHISVIMIKMWTGPRARTVIKEESNVVDSDAIAHHESDGTQL